MNNSTKLEGICSRLAIEGCPSSYVRLCDILAVKIKNGEGVNNYLNCISSTFLSEVIEILTNVKLTPSNMSLYRQKGYNLVSDISYRLKLPVVHNLVCDVVKGTGNQLVFLPNTKTPSMALKAIQQNGMFQVRNEIYSFWQKSGTFNIGDKRNWPSVSLLDWLYKNSYCLTAPASHNTPVRLKRLTRHISSCINNKTGFINQEELNNTIHKFCISELSLNAFKGGGPWLPEINGLPEISYLDSFTPDVLQSPYFYVRSVGQAAKIGSADRTNSRVKRDNQAVIIKLNTRPESGEAKKIESLVRRELQNIKIFPVDNKLDHYALQLRDIAPMVLSILARNPGKIYNIHSITALNLNTDILRK